MKEREAMIETSINIERNRMNRILDAAKRMGISESELFSILLMKSRKLFGNKAVTGKTVEYQESDSINYVIHHISLFESDYELATGRRYLFKISVSFIFRLAVDFCLSGILYEWVHKKTTANQEWKEYITNIHYQSFMIRHINKEFSEIWKIPWPGSRT